MDSRNLLIAEAVYYSGRWADVVSAISSRAYLPDEEIVRILRNIKCKVVTILDKEYPQYLKKMYQPPLVLFYYGNLSLLNDYNINIGIVGTRKPSEVGAKVTHDITSKIAKRYIVVSGLAAGIDRIAHRTSINFGGKTIAVLGCGIEKCYPTSNQDLYDEIKKNPNCLLISEYPGFTPPHKDNFPFRNRLIAQFSKAILVTESKRKSGTAITVGYGLFYGKDIMCVPSSNYNDSGCNLFLKEGAILVENSEHVIEIME